MFNFYSPWERQKTTDFLTFSGSIEMEQWLKMYEFGSGKTFNYLDS